MLRLAGTMHWSGKSFDLKSSMLQFASETVAGPICVMNSKGFGDYT